MSNASRGVHLVGSINLEDRAAVFAAVSTHLKDDVRAVPDGETGDRRLWVSWEMQRLAQLPAVQVTGHRVLQVPDYGESRTPLLNSSPGTSLADADLGPFRYADTAIDSYKSFADERDAGNFKPGTRFQVSMPTPMMFAMNFGSERRQALPALERGLRAQVDQLLQAIPGRDLALQWDVAGEIVAQEGFRQTDSGRGFFGADYWPVTEATESIARVSKDIPDEVFVGLHLCYGDPEGEHLIQPKDLGLSVEFYNDVATRTNRQFDWVHMPVPIDRDDDAYFEPLTKLNLSSGTRLYLGLVHKEDGLEGAARRLASAARYAQNFGVAAECGMGREPHERVESLLALHHDVAAL